MSYSPMPFILRAYFACSCCRRWPTLHRLLLLRLWNTSVSCSVPARRYRFEADVPQQLFGVRIINSCGISRLYHQQAPLSASIWNLGETGTSWV
ncbi:hypothetical protein B0T10DRAFT_469508 [Thelonectria olida]|uniref:Secreted protein n=1 Tax=Thelonectria olida TaxID=1576542 RepID=A0A9P8WKD1_9HYPO|nr:hypothetical protein B0T10DRAFT_469508 [Thelonectria olida]